jgi:hypothetical protein
MTEESQFVTTTSKRTGNTHTQIGLIAQEVELVSPGSSVNPLTAIEDGNDLATVTKSDQLLSALHEGSQGAAGSNRARSKPLKAWLPLTTSQLMNSNINSLP